MDAVEWLEANFEKTWNAYGCKRQLKNGLIQFYMNGGIIRSYMNGGVGRSPGSFMCIKDDIGQTVHFGDTEGSSYGNARDVA